MITIDKTDCKHYSYDPKSGWGVCGKDKVSNIFTTDFDCSNCQDYQERNNKEEKSPKSTMPEKPTTQGECYWYERGYKEGMQFIIRSNASNLFCG